MHDEIVEYRQSAVQQMSRRAPWQAWVILSTIILGGSGFCLWQIKDKIAWVGYVIIALVLLVLLIIATAAVLWLIRQFRTVDIIPIDTTGGTYLRDKMTGRVTPLAPLQAAAPRGSRDPALTKSKVQVAIPKLSELLETKTLRPGLARMLLGIHEDVTPRWGTWEEDVKTIGVGGRGRSGKSNTMFFYVIQALFAGATVWLADPHFSKKTGLTTLLGPLRKWIRIAGTAEEIHQMMLDLASEIIDRKRPDSGPHRPFVFVGDEWNGIIQDLELLSKELNEKESYSDQAAGVVVKVEREMAGYNMYAILGVHSWMDREIGGTALRRLIHSVICHRMPEDYSKHILPKKTAPQTEQLRTGHAIFRDNEGYCEKLIMPLGEAQDAFTAAEMLEQAYQAEEELLPTGFTTPQLPPPSSTQRPNPHYAKRIDLYNSPTVPVNTSKSGQTGPLVLTANEAVKRVNQPVEVSEESEEDIEVHPEDLANSEQSQQILYTPVEETEVLNAAMQVHRRLVEEGSKRSPYRVEILNQLREITGETRWNRKQWAKLAAICEKYNL